MGEWSQSSFWPEDSHAKTSPTRARGSASPAPARGYGASSSAPFAWLDLDTSLWRTFQGSLEEEWERYSETWPPSGTTRSGRAYRQRPLVPRTFAGASSFWHTPNVPNGGRVNPEDMSPTGLLPNGKKRQVGLEHQVRMVEREMWPTPSANQYECDLEVWTARREREKAKGRNGNGFGLTLSMAVQERAQWATPSAHPRTHSPRRVHHGRQLANEVGGQLNPTWVEWLMGFPEGWTDLGG